MFVMTVLYCTIGFFDEAAVGVDSSAVVLLLGLLLSQPQDVLQPIESNLNDLGVHHSQQITQWLNAAQIYQISVCKHTCNRVLEEKSSVKLDPTTKPLGLIWLLRCVTPVISKLKTPMGSSTLLG